MTNISHLQTNLANYLTLDTQYESAIVAQRTWKALSQNTRKNTQNSNQTNYNTTDQPTPMQLLTSSEECPTGGKCLSKRVVYQAEVTTTCATTENKETNIYVGVNSERIEREMPATIYEVLEY